MNYNIRPLKISEVGILDTFLYEAIYIPKGVEAPPFEIIKQPELRVYVSEFGRHDGDFCLVAESDDAIVGAIWCRIMDDYGHVDDETPSLAISVLKSYRGHGIGTALLQKMLPELRLRGYAQVSLAVQKENYALRMYRKAGFTIVDEHETEYVMVCQL